MYPILNSLTKRLYKRKLFKKIEEIKEIDLISDYWIYSNYPHYNSEDKYNEICTIFKNKRRYCYWGKFFNDYSYSFKAIKKQYLDTVVKDILWLDWLKLKFNKSSYQVYGVYPDIKIYLKKDNILHKFLNVIWNILTIFSGSLYFTFWLTLKIRPFQFKKDFYDLIADNNSPSFKDFFNNLIKKDQKIIFFSFPKKHDNESVDINDALVTPLSFFKILLCFYGETLFLCSRLKSWDSEFFFLQFRQIIGYYCYTAFFNKYDTKAFFLLDDYSKGHIVRTMVLRKLGIKSVSTNHGLPYRVNQTGFWHYVDYDIYYSYGKFLYENFYKNTWSKLLINKDIGSLRIPKELYSEKLNKSRNKDILFLWGKSESKDIDSLLIKAIYSLSDEFNDRKIHVRPKPSRIIDNSTSKLFEVLDLHPRKNIILQDRDLAGKYLTYELMNKCKYAVSVGTTALAEAIQFRCIPFFLDYDYKTKDVYYKNFPQLCVDSIDVMINKLKNLEAKNETYDFENFNELINQKIIDPIPLIRKDLGLDL